MCWLPKNERMLLKFYYSKIGGKYKGSLDLDKETIIATMKLLNSYSWSDDGLGTELEIMDNPIYKKVCDAHGYLIDRELLELFGSSTNCKQNAHGGVIYKMKCIRLTTEGYDLGRKYNHWFSRLGLWWGEHKANPIWIGVGFVLTTIVSFVLGILKEKYK